MLALILLLAGCSRSTEAPAPAPEEAPAAAARRFPPPEDVPACARPGEASKQLPSFPREVVVEVQAATEAGRYDGVRLTIDGRLERRRASGPWELVEELAPARIEAVRELLAEAELERRPRVYRGPGADAWVPYWSLQAWVEGAPYGFDGVDCGAPWADAVVAALAEAGVALR